MFYIFAQHMSIVDRIMSTYNKYRRAGKSVWPDWAIYWTLGNFLKPLVTINLPTSLTFLSNFCKGVKIFHFSGEIIFGQLIDIWLLFTGHTEVNQNINGSYYIGKHCLQFILYIKVECQPTLLATMQSFGPIRRGIITIIVVLWYGLARLHVF